MSRIYADNGSKIGKGEVLGLVGSTGYSTGPHLHFEVRKNGKPTDPLKWLP
jgi:murein DD-endopeptidase MepM/ murein hydrolase activator NlpD